MKPTAIDILGRKIPIKYIAKKDLDLIIRGAEGIYDTYEKTIYINKEAPKDVQKYYLRHECGHALLHFTGLDQVISPELQEVVVQSFATMAEDFFNQHSKFR